MIKLFTKTIIDYNKELSVRNMHNTNTDYSNYLSCYSLTNDINKMRIIKAN